MEKCMKRAQAILFLLVCFAIHAQCRGIGVQDYGYQGCTSKGKIRTGCYTCLPLEVCYSTLADCKAHCTRPPVTITSLVVPH
ncbi:hypothetical protein CFC21_068625 [Triticum aestivum]|uniref:Uncharacterized protein n=2 Tax=Triticum aestivum TaxID=4565 RepID=A0A9R1KPX6_WHEAT|nr:hypothetical protein CFC21_068625 [Triticum aestivum]